MSLFSAVGRCLLLFTRGDAPGTSPLVGAFRMNKINDIYNDADYETRTKAKILLWVQGVLLAALVIYEIAQVIGTFVGSEMQFAPADVPVCLLIVVLFIAMRLLRAGRYDTSARLTFWTLIPSIMLGNILAGYEGRFSISGLALSVVVLFFAASLFYKSRREMEIMGTLIGVAFFAIVAVWAQTDSFKANGSVSTQLALPGLMLMLGLTVANILHSVFLGISSDHIEQMQKMQKVQEQRAQVLNEVAGQLGKSTDLSSSAEETAAATVEIEQNVKNIKARISELKTRFDSSRKALANIDDSIKLLQQHSDDQTEIVGESGKAVESMVESIRSVAGAVEARSASVNTLKDAARGGAESIEQTKQSFQNVAHNIESIEEMTGIISNISSQTNLLAMNAAIEAAHAGESGKGFAVVADEIRKLAESSAVNADSISKTLEELVDAIKQTGVNVQNSGDSFDRVRGEVDAVGSSFQDIAASTENLNSGTAQITGSAKELGKASDDIKTNIISVSKAYSQIMTDLSTIGDTITEVSSGMDEIATGATEIREAVSSIEDSAVALKDETEKLNRSL